MSAQPFPWRSLLLAPFACVPVLVLAGWNSGDAVAASSVAAGVMFAALIGIPASFFGLAIVGVPAYLLLRRFGLVRLWIIAAIGLLVPFTLFVGDAPTETTLMAVLSGVAVSVVAYWLRPLPASPQPVAYQQFGDNHGRLVVYFHGAPGAPEECAVFDAQAKHHKLTFICIDRCAIEPSLRGDAYYRFLAEEITRLAAGKSIDMVGFSIGAFIALQTARHMNDGLTSVHLVSAAAPLDAGDYLEAMAGKQVFKLARTSPILFCMLSTFQGLLLRLSPNTVFRLLFASAAGQDQVLAANRAFRLNSISAFKACLAGNVRGYMRDIELYVKPWRETLTAITVDTHLWHGAKDNWAPAAMAVALKQGIPGCRSLSLFDELSHYSCLHQAAPDICRHIAGQSLPQEVSGRTESDQR